jgi:ABC-type iron transport system FetAB permease component
MGMRPRASLIWLLITGSSIFPGGWIGYQDFVRGYWYALAFVVIICAIAAWLVARIIERILSKRLNVGEITPLVICGYVVAFALLTLIMSRLVGLAYYWVPFKNLVYANTKEMILSVI